MNADSYHYVIQAEGVLAEREAKQVRATVSPQREPIVWSDTCTDKCQLAVPRVRW